MAEIDWSDPEAVVSAAVPDARFDFACGHKWMCGIFSNALQLSAGQGWLCGLVKRKSERRMVWQRSLNHPTVQAFIAANRPEGAQDGE